MFTVDFWRLLLQVVNLDMLSSRIAEYLYEYAIDFVFLYSERSYEL